MPLLQTPSLSFWLIEPRSSSEETFFQEQLQSLWTMFKPRTCRARGKLKLWFEDAQTKQAFCRDSLKEVCRANIPLLHFHCNNIHVSSQGPSFPAFEAHHPGCQGNRQLHATRVVQSKWKFVYFLHNFISSTSSTVAALGDTVYNTLLLLSSFSHLYFKTSQRHHNMFHARLGQGTHKCTSFRQDWRRSRSQWRVAKK